MRQRKMLVLFSFSCLCLGGCRLGNTSLLAGRWFSKEVSIRFRENGTVLYNSQITGLVEGRYQYDPKLVPAAGTKPVKNLTLWLPQPGQTLVLDFEMRFLGGDRIHLKRVPRSTASTPASADLSQTFGTILKRATDQGANSNGLDDTPPLVSASRGSQN